MSADRPITKEDLGALLASALGHEKSDEVVTGAVRALGIHRPGLTSDDVRSIFGVLVKADGLVGVVARFAVSRGDVDKLMAHAPRPEAPQQIGRPQFRVGGPSHVPAALPSAHIDLTPLLSPALGVEKARDAIEQAAARRGVDVATGLSYNGALSILDEMTKVEGIVGVVARFAKARFLLNPSG